MSAALTHLFGQTYTTYSTPTPPSNSAVAVIWIIALAIGVVGIVAMWKVFTKAGKPGWASIVPIYNTLVLLEVIGRPWWWILLMFIPIVNLVVIVIVYNDLAKAFGYGIGMTLALIFFPYIAMLVLAFGDSKYGGVPQHA